MHAIKNVEIRHVWVHPEDRQDIDRWFEQQWEGRPESRGLKSAVG